MRDIDSIARGGTGTGDNMNDMMKESIKQIKVLVMFPVFPVLDLRFIKNTHPLLGSRNRNNGDRHGLSGILNTIIGTTSTILNIFNEATNAIPVPFVHPLVASVASLLTAVQVSFRILVFVGLRTNDCVSKLVLIMATWDTSLLLRESLLSYLRKHALETKWNLRAPSNRHYVGLKSEYTWLSFYPPLLTNILGNCTISLNNVTNWAVAMFSGDSSSRESIRIVYRVWSRTCTMRL